MAVYEPHEVDRLYRTLPHLLDGAMVARPIYDEAPRARRPVDELPDVVVEAMNRWMALEALTVSQRLVFKAVVMGLVRVERAGCWQDAYRGAMTYRQCGDYLDLDEKAVGEHLRRARVKLAARLSDEEAAAA